MQSFKLTLANGATLTGLSNLPPHNPTTTPKYRPLMVGLHGGSYSAGYFDVNEKVSASITSNGLGVPWVAIDRPGYRTSTSFNPIPEGSSYFEMIGSWLHAYILPALWSEFGAPQGCTGVVLHCHSLGTTGGVISAGLHATEIKQGKTPAYPLLGVISSGFGTRSIYAMETPEPKPEFIEIPGKHKDAMFLPPGSCDESVWEHTDRLNEPLPVREVDEVRAVWLERFKTEWAPLVEVPVMIGIAERDVFWEGSEEHVRDFGGAFTASPRVDGSLIRGATHNLEMNYWAPGWYARCFGFGLECAASFALAGLEV
ncbi:hypothetical protein QBC47DRAFT_191956 [Echria macrotheca]|uniref:AB hydrolase-1 domain-containing protein n=1 Tax=Echria macrotheca TaxID=438768 RepID=A0AAJ0F5D5_9PEZI|nr:hypothetical protein QBC47DRAFT_191956 [Echria macrotheca]